MNLNFTLILQIISFLILLGLLTKFLYKPLTKYLDERAEAIKNMTESIKSAEEKARLYAAETHKALQMTREESSKVKKESRRLADEDRKKIIEEAKKEARFLIEGATEQLNVEKNVILKKMQKEIADISLDIARKILGREITKEDHKRIIEESISEMENEIPRS